MAEQMRRTGDGPLAVSGAGEALEAFRGTGDGRKRIHHYRDGQRLPEVVALG